MTATETQALSGPADATKVEVGERLPRRELDTVDGKRVVVPDPDGALVHLQLRRFAGCPVCNLHLQSIVRRHDEIAAASIREIVVFHSTREALAPFTADLPFAVVPDPGKRLYGELGAEFAPRALLSPRVWRHIVRGVALSLSEMIRKRRRSPPLFPRGGRTGLPAEFLIAGDGRVLARKYGDHAYDQWTVDELLALARGADVEGTS